ncbi:hypothetical protein PG994_013404 [Apiospora phragmitis]|uniref:Uncharacterized protein n=1 Tax=Apiospora phragmitis TaxID=2905665 RepID=A0ABR1TA96_9PEZI
MFPRSYGSGVAFEAMFSGDVPQEGDELLVEGNAGVMVKQVACSVRAAADLGSDTPRIRRAWSSPM